MDDKDRILHLLTGPIQTNTYVYACDGKAMVVDPAGEGDRVAALLADEGLEISLIVGTHGHPDHVGGVAALKQASGAPFLLHAADAEAAQRCAHDPSIPLPVDGDAPAPDRLVAEGDVLELGSASFLVVETPGHTPGGVCLIGRGSAGDVAFVGDTLFAGSVGRTDLPGGSARTLMASVARLGRELGDACVVLPGHGPETTMADERRSNPYLLRALRHDEA